MQRPHVVLLGAGGSRAAFPKGEATGRRLPLMTDFVEIVGLRTTLKKAGFTDDNRNFEDVYTDLARDPALRVVREEVDEAVFEYFSSLRLFDEPTLYDHLVLSLRPKDVIATFNWDPFLIQAARRNRGVSEPPKLLFLHGNVLHGYCAQDRMHGAVGASCSRCGNNFASVRLLYPVREKNYESEAAIQEAWEHVRWAFQNAFMVTVFGYSVPQTDAAAVELLRNAWGGWQKRTLEQFEFIDIRNEDELVSSWAGFISPSQHHYEFHTSFYDSWIAKHARRTGEAWWSQYLEVKVVGDNLAPRTANLAEVQQWYRQLASTEVANVD